MSKFAVRVDAAVSALGGGDGAALDENDFIDASRLVYDAVREIRRAVLMNRTSDDLDTDTEFEPVEDMTMETRSRSSAHTGEHGVDEYPDISGITNAREAMRKMTEEDKRKILQQVELFRREKMTFDNEVAKWDDAGNDIIMLAKHMCMIMLEMTDFTRGRGPLKTTMDVINAAKKISEAGTKLDKLTREIAEQCPESSTKQDLLAYLQRIALYCHQIQITSKVKADVQNISGELIVSGMADDIDIEEHDILDNPRIQDILHIKEELIDINSDFYEEPTHAYNDKYNQYEPYTENYENQYQIPFYDHEPPDKPEPPYNEEETQDPESSDTVSIDQDMVLKLPDTDFNETDIDFDESMSDTEARYSPDLSNEIYHHNNKIILGTKPCKRPTRDVYGAYVYLEDWGGRLDNSHCYCKECQTLFATQNALDAHNMIAHSFLVALDSPESSESETPAVQGQMETAKYCDHCKRYFPSDHALIQHLYDLITANKQAPTAQATVRYLDCTNTGQHMVYSCLICNSAYLDIKWFKVHIRTVHKNPGLGSFEHIPFTGVCKICKHTYTNLKRFNCHVKSVHIDKNDYEPRESAAESLESSSVNVESQENVESELENVETLPENEESQSDNKSQTSTESVSARVTGTSVVRTRKNRSNFKCIKCKSFYSSIKSVRNHQRQYHKGEKIIKKLGHTSVMSNKVKDMSQIVSGTVSHNVPELKLNSVFEKVKFVDNLVPKNSVFKCNECGIHVVTCWSAILHTCLEMISRYQCDVCFKQFRLKDANIHQQQHKYNDAFNTYYISKNMNTKMLFWCQKCAAYFEITKIQNHLSVCNGTSFSVRCKLCEIDVNDILTHMHHHKVHTAKTDFIYIDDLLPGSMDEEVSSQKDLKRKLPIDAVPGPSKVKKLDANQFMYCNLCYTCMKTTIHGCHETGECKKIKAKRNCEFCGLVFFSGSPTIYHEEFHRKFNAKLKDFTFVDVSDQMPTVPRIPEFPKCEKCDTHDFAAHKCGVSKSCKICNQKFSESAFKLHLLHHKYLKEDTEVNALIKKYKTLASTWNILYLCKACNVATDSYDDVVVHCQNHYNSIQDCATRNCEFCCLKIEETCFKRHKELHSPSITRNSFKTVVYDFENLVNEDWLKLFGNLSEAEVQQIVTRSIYVTRFVKMKLILDGPPELTIYKCETCKLYVDSHAVYNHSTLCVTPQDFNKKSYSCETCLIPFSTATARKEHEKLHTTPNITANSFRIVAFNDKSDREFNTNLQFDADALELKPKTPINVHAINKKTNILKTTIKTVIFYQCGQCKCCSLNAESLVRHRCSPEKELKRCKKCQIYISSTNIKEHRKWHKLNTNITKDHIKLVAIDNNILTRTKSGKASDVVKKLAYKLHQCKKCKVCYSFWVKHSSCSMKYRRCKKCGYLFSYSSYVIHDMWHEQNVNATKNDIKVVPLSHEQSSQSKIERRRFLKTLKFNSNNVKVDELNVDQRMALYQCARCKLCSYTIAFVKKHTICSSNKKGIYNCKVCDLKFKFYGMRYHKSWHKDNANRTRQHIQVLPFKGMKILKIKSETVKKSIKKDDASSNIISNGNGYNCKKCGASSKKSIFLKKHNCETSPEKSKTSLYLYYQCQDCGVCVASKRHYCIPAHRIRVCPRCKLKFSFHSIYDHMKKHATHKNMTRSKITLVPFKKNLNSTELDEATVSKPVEKVSTVYRCSCGLHFITQKTIERHFTVCSPDHDIPSENCSKCGLLFPTNHLVSHLCNHHSYGKGNIEVKTIPTVTHYRCGSCKCLFVNEMRLLKHNKRCDPDKYKGVRCDECDLDFHDTEIKVHRESHKTLCDLYKPSRIVTINNNTQKLDNKQTKSNESEAEDELRIENDNCLFKCNDCGAHYLKFNTFSKHLINNQCFTENRPLCSHCGLCFTKRSLYRHVLLHHKKKNLKLEDFVISICDSTMVKRYSKGGLVEKKTSASVIKSDDESSDKKVDLFKCRICNVHFLKVISLRNHVLSGTHTIIKIDCLKCGLAFPEKAIELHKILHHKKMRLGVKDFHIVEKRKYESIAKKVVGKTYSQIHIENKKHGNLTKNDLDEPLETTVVVNEKEEIIYYNCVKCSVHFMSSRSLDTHFEEKHKRKHIETCDLCGLTFHSLTKHRHHHEGKLSGVFLIQDVDYESDSVNKLFKCLECGLHFVKPQTLMVHVNKHAHTLAGSKCRNVNCPDCGLLFSVITLKLHQARHHGGKSLRLEDLIIDTSFGKYRVHRFGSDDNNMVSQSSSEDVTTEDNNTELTEEHPETNEPQVKPFDKSPNSSTKLYKCGKCNVYFLTQATCYKHIVKHTSMDSKEYIECKLCSFQFRIVSLNTHIRKHHKTNSAFDKVLIEEYQPKLDEEKVPKIDIYYAKDKVQSRLISTTTEDTVEDSAEISQSDIEPTVPEASNDPKKTVIITNTDNLDAGIELDNENKNVMVKMPSFTDIKEEEVSFEEVVDGGSKEGKYENEVPPKDTELSDMGHTCGYCSETFVSRRAKDFHESLDHLDALKDCPVCKKSFNTSVLNELHLQIKNEMFTCCFCSQISNVTMLPHHSFIHKNML